MFRKMDCGRNEKSDWGCRGYSSFWKKNLVLFTLIWIPRLPNSPNLIITVGLLYHLGLRIGSTKVFFFFASLLEYLQRIFHNMQPCFPLQHFGVNSPLWFGADVFFTSSLNVLFTQWSSSIWELRLFFFFSEKLQIWFRLTKEISVVTCFFSCLYPRCDAYLL